MTIFYIFLGVLIFGVLIAIHEFGHFIVAKLCHVRVEEFSVGMGPAIWHRQKGETVYSLRVIPFGGYCAMTGEDGESDDPRAFTNQAAWKRFLILVAGAFNNFVLGFVIVLLLYAGSAGFRAPVVTGFMEGCPYESAEGLQAGDRFVKINGRRVLLFNEVSEFLLSGQDTGEYDLVLRRGGKTVTLQDFHMVPQEYEGREGRYFGLLFEAVDEGNFANTLKYSWNTTRYFVRMVWFGLSELVHGHVSVNDMAGPGGIVDMMAQQGTQAESTKDGIFDVLYLGALIAVNLAVMNLLPIPALDGGQILFLAIDEGQRLFTHKKLNPKIQGTINSVMMVLLLALMGYIMLHDIVRIVQK
jgi:regulator of sigma E protease